MSEDVKDRIFRRFSPFLPMMAPTKGTGQSILWLTSKVSPLVEALVVSWKRAWKAVSGGHLRGESSAVWAHVFVAQKSPYEQTYKQITYRSNDRSNRRPLTAGTVRDFIVVLIRSCRPCRRGVARRVPYVDLIWKSHSPGLDDGLHSWSRSDSTSELQNPEICHRIPVLSGRLGPTRVLMKIYAHET